MRIAGERIVECRAGEIFYRCQRIAAAVAVIAGRAGKQGCGYVAGGVRVGRRIGSRAAVKRIGGSPAGKRVVAVAAAQDFAPESPSSTSVKAEPVRFSKPDRVSVPALTVFCAVTTDRSTWTPAAALA